MNILVDTSALALHEAQITTAIQPLLLAIGTSNLVRL